MELNNILTSVWTKSVADFDSLDHLFQNRETQFTPILSKEISITSRCDYIFNIKRTCPLVVALKRKVKRKC